MTPVRALPRVFLPGCPREGRFELPTETADRLRKVLRLGTGDPVAVLPDDGTILRARLDGKSVVFEGEEPLATERAKSLTVLQALPKGDKLDELLRSCTELGVARFVLFHSERSVMRWDDPKKIAQRTERARAIVRESAELAFRARLPSVEFVPTLPAALALVPDAVALDEDGSLLTPLTDAIAAVAVGPEGGWTSGERALFQDRRATLGPLVLRTEHAAAAAAAKLLL